MAITDAARYNLNVISSLFHMNNILTIAELAEFNSFNPKKCSSLEHFDKIRLYKRILTNNKSIISFYTNYAHYGNLMLPNFFTIFGDKLFESYVFNITPEFDAFIISEFSNIGKNLPTIEKNIYEEDCIIYDEEFIKYFFLADVELHDNLNLIEYKKIRLYVSNDDTINRILSVSKKS